MSVQGFDPVRTLVFWQYLILAFVVPSEILGRHPHCLSHLLEFSRAVVLFFVHRPSFTFRLVRSQSGSDLRTTYSSTFLVDCQSVRGQSKIDSLEAREYTPF